MNGPSSKSSMPKIHFELASTCILKNQSSNFRGSTAFRDMSREIQAQVVSPTGRFAPKVCSPLVYIRSSVESNLGLNCLQTAKVAAILFLVKTYFNVAPLHYVCS